MNANRREYLDTQIILSIQNEGVWYQQTRLFLGKAENFNGWCEYTARWAQKVNNGRVRLEASDYAYVQAELYDQLVRDQVFLDIYERPTTWYLAREKFEPGTIQKHLDKAEELLGGVEEKFNAAIEEAKELNAMQNTPFITKNYVFGQDVASMTEDQLIAALKKVEGEIESLKTVKTKSKKIEQMIKDAEAGLAKIVEVLDAK